MAPCKLTTRSLSLAISMALPVASLAPAAGCDAGETDATQIEHRMLDDVLVSNSVEFVSSADAPLTLGADLFYDLMPYVPAFSVDGQEGVQTTDILTAEHFVVPGIDGSPLYLERTGARAFAIANLDGEAGVAWSADFSQLRFTTPQGTFTLELEGGLQARRDMTSLMILLGLNGDSRSLFLAAPAAGAAALWPAVAIAGLIAVTVVVSCFAFAQMCWKQAEAMCSSSGGVKSVHVSCGAVSFSMSSPTDIPDVEFEFGGFSCSQECHSDGGDPDPNPAPPPPNPEPFPTPDPNWEESLNPCPPGQRPVPCVKTTETMTSDTSGDIEEVTVTSSSEFAYCCG